jgi:hypothetical protein
MSVLASLKRVTILKIKERRLSAAKRRKIKRELQSLLKDSTGQSRKFVKRKAAGQSSMNEASYPPAFRFWHSPNFLARVDRWVA